MPWQIDVHIDKNHAAMRGTEWDNFYELNRKEKEFSETVIPPPSAIHKDVYKHFYRGLRTGDAVNPDHFMRVLRLGAKTRRPLPHFFKRSDKRNVSEVWRLAIESLEPGVHQFIPIEIYDEKGNPYEIKYYYINIRNILDAIDPDSDNIIITVGQYNLIRPIDIKLPWPLLREKFEGRHLWLQSKDGLGRQDMFLSDELFKRVKDLRPQSWRARPCTVR